MLLNDDIKSRFLELCEEYEIFGDTQRAIYCEADLIEQGLVDSMTTVYLQTIISDHFSIDIPNEVIVLELRTIDDIVRYVQTSIANREST
jgi:acyl carrier protein